MGTALAGSGVGLTACDAGGSAGNRSPVPVARTDGLATLLAPSADTLEVSLALLGEAAVVVVSSPAQVREGVTVADHLGVPLLVDGDGLAAELARLRVTTVVGVGAAPSRPGMRLLAHRTGDPAPRIPGLPPERISDSAIVLADPGVPAPAAALGPLLRSVGARTVPMTGTDPRADRASLTALRAHPKAPVLRLGPPDSAAGRFAALVRTARVAKELPGGGLLPFRGRRMVALYGHPSTRSLGMLGEQGPAAAVRRVTALADRYAALLGSPVVPAFEIIATVAAGAPGSDGAYSTHTPTARIVPWLDAAEAAGVYTVLDLQPGRADFPTQAAAYEELLRRPWVGLALDPEWRLGPGEKPLQRIGSVDVDEVNATSAWLAALVREHDLPPKVFTVHQFQRRMVRDRERLVTDHDELQVLIHVDGSGSQPAKQSTWATVRADLPSTVWLGWKNFEDEDHPMLTPEETVEQVRPMPSFISYQ